MIQQPYFLAAVPLLLALSVALHAESFEEKQAQTDMANAESVWQLAQWCSQNNQPSKARQLWNQVIKLDKDHEGARAALGQVRVGERWVNKTFAPKQTAPGGGAASESGGRAGAAGPGPKASEVAWNLSIPVDPSNVENPFLDGYVARLRTSPNDSDAMSGTVATLIREDNWASALPRICKALLSPGFDDVYGTAELVIMLQKEGRSAEARRLVPFMVKCSEKVTNPEDLEHMAMVLITVRERKSVPRLIELMTHANEGVRSSAAEAISAITNLPNRDLTADKVKAWWNANWSLSEDEVLLEQLRSSDPEMAVAAAAGLCDVRNKAIFPVLFKLLRNDNPVVVKQAIDVLRRATSLDWGLSPQQPVDQRSKTVERLEKWWKDEQFRFAWPGLPKQDDAAAAVVAKNDPDAEAVEKLGSTTGKDATEAEARLRGRGNAAVPSLLNGLASQSPLIRRRAHDILREITKQDFKYDPRADEGDRQGAVEAWRAWAIKQKLIADPAAE